MFTSFDPHFNAAVNTGLMLACFTGRGRIDAGVALARRIAR